ncbi:Disease resistance protein RPS5 [Raphanus sativus]|nr:Disease resistance protein RPS5 [Raphanus sativus]
MMARQTDVWRRVEELERLESLSIDISSSSALEELFSADELAGCIKEACIRDVREEEYKTIVLPTMESLTKLIIRSCDISEIEIGRTPWDIIRTKARLRNLTSVIVTGCNGLKDLTWLLFVPNLTHLELRCLEKVEKIISEEKVSSSVTDERKARGMNITFQKLERLDLINLPRLKRIYWSPLIFPCLKKIEVEKCPKLRKLPLSFESRVGGEDLLIKYRDDQWFKRVRWEDKAPDLALRQQQVVKQSQFPAVATVCVYYPSELSFCLDYSVLMVCLVCG